MGSDLEAGHARSATPAVRGPRLALPLIALFLLVVGAKSMLIGALGSPLPFVDQWDAEAANLYRPYLEGTLSLGQLFAPVYEHRIFFSRLLMLGLFELDGGWDPILEMLVNALLHAAFVVMFTAYLAGAAPVRLRLLILAFSAFCFMLPVGFENTLMGMNAHFYLLLLFSFGAVTLLARAEAFAWRWFIGLALAIAAEFTVASGALTAWAAGAVIVVQLALSVRRGGREVAGAAVVLLVGAGLLAGIILGPDNQPLHAHGAGDFVGAAVTLLSLPLVPIAGAVFLHAPMAWFAFDAARLRLTRDDRAWGLIGLAVWVLGQVAATAYARAEVAVASRYLDLILLLLPLDLVALGAVWSREPEARLWVARYAATWLFVVVAVLGVESYLSSWRLAALQKSHLDGAVPRVTAYLAIGDIGQLKAIPFLFYRDIDGLGVILSYPLIRDFLPGVIRPLDADPLAAQQKTVLKGRLAGVAGGLKAVLLAGPLWLALGAGLCFLLAARRILAPPRTG